MKRFYHSMIAILLFWLMLQPATDPDTGWHIATGRWIVQNHQIPATDPFSFSLPSHPYIAHSWGFDVLAYVITDWVGPVGLSVFFALISTAALWLLYRISCWLIKISIPSWMLLIIAPVAVEVIGQRPQAISVLGLAVTLWYVVTGLPKNHWLLPALFFIWANLHGGFIWGIALLIAWHSIDLIMRGAKPSTSGILQIIIAVLATLVNPYTYRIYQFAFGMATNSVSRLYNTDWAPLFSAQLDPSTLPLRLGLIAAAALTIIDNRHLKKPTILGLTLLAASLYSLRYLVPLFVILTPLMLLTLYRLTRLNFATRFILIAITTLSIFSQTGTLIQKSHLIAAQDPVQYAGIASYPYQHLQVIKRINPQARIFNHYTWGGYISWQLPDSKIFIDGRMDNFFLDGESFLLEFVAIERLEDGWYEKLMHYQPDFALIPSNWQWLIDGLVEKQWAILHRDETATLLQKH